MTASTSALQTVPAASVDLPDWRALYMVVFWSLETSRQRVDFAMYAIPWMFDRIRAIPLHSRPRVQGWQPESRVFSRRQWANYVASNYQSEQKERWG